MKITDVCLLKNGRYTLVPIVNTRINHCKKFKGILMLNILNMIQKTSFVTNVTKVSFIRQPSIITPIMHAHTQIPKKFQNILTKSFGLDLKFFYCPLLPQGKLTDVPIYFKIVTIQVIGQTILAWCTT